MTVMVTDEDLRDFSIYCAGGAVHDQVCHRGDALPVRTRNEEEAPWSGRHRPESGQAITVRYLSKRT